MEITKEQIDLFENPKKCFFQYKEFELKCPGLVLAEIKLPIARSSNLFFLVLDRTGEYYWFPSAKVQLVP
jgi:hypothetical protein